MPLTAKGQTIKSAMEKEYGPGKGERVFYAAANKGTITGVHDAQIVDFGYDPTVGHNPQRGDINTNEFALLGQTTPPKWDSIAAKVDAFCAKVDSIVASSHLPGPTGPTSFRVTKDANPIETFASPKY